MSPAVAPEYAIRARFPAWRSRGTGTTEVVRAKAVGCSRADRWGLSVAGSQSASCMLSVTLAHSIRGPMGRYLRLGVGQPVNQTTPIDAQPSPPTVLQPGQSNGTGNIRRNRNLWLPHDRFRATWTAILPWLDQPDDVAGRRKNGCRGSSNRQAVSLEPANSYGACLVCGTDKTDTHHLTDSV